MDQWGFTLDWLGIDFKYIYMNDKNGNFSGPLESVTSYIIWLTWLTCLNEPCIVLSRMKMNTANKLTTKPIKKTIFWNLIILIKIYSLMKFIYPIIWTYFPSTQNLWMNENLQNTRFYVYIVKWVIKRFYYFLFYFMEKYITYSKITQIFSHTNIWFSIFFLNWIEI